MTEETQTQDEPQKETAPASPEENIRKSEETDTGTADNPKPKKKGKDKNIKIKESEYQQLQEEARESKDKYLRIFAEFENARKRMEREKMEFAKYANEEILVDFLGLFDNLERSLHFAKQQGAENLVNGLELVIKEAREILRKNGVEPIEAVGKAFDPHQHEILLQEENDEVEDGTVLEELQKGYVMDAKVIRTTKVKVSTKSSN